MNNLVTLCASCHNNQHEHNIKASTAGGRANDSGSKNGLVAIGISIISGGMLLLTPNLVFDMFGPFMRLLMFPILVLVSVVSGAFGVTHLIVK